MAAKVLIPRTHDAKEHKCIPPANIHHVMGSGLKGFSYSLGTHQSCCDADRVAKQAFRLSSQPARRLENLYPRLKSFHHHCRSRFGLQLWVSCQHCSGVAINADVFAELFHDAVQEQCSVGTCVPQFSHLEQLYCS
jgi:hypothetical protein